MSENIRNIIAWMASLAFIGCLFALMYLEVSRPASLVLYLGMPTMVILIYMMIGRSPADR